MNSSVRMYVYSIILVQLEEENALISFFSKKKNSVVISEVQYACT